MSASDFYPNFQAAYCNAQHPFTLSHEVTQEVLPHEVTQEVRQKQMIYVDRSPWFLWRRGNEGNSKKDIDRLSEPCNELAHLATAVLSSMVFTPGQKAIGANNHSLHAMWITGGVMIIFENATHRCNRRLDQWASCPSTHDQRQSTKHTAQHKICTDRPYH